MVQNFRHCVRSNLFRQRMNQGPVLKLKLCSRTCKTLYSLAGFDLTTRNQAEATRPEHGPPIFWQEEEVVSETFTTSIISTPFHHNPTSDNLALHSLCTFVRFTYIFLLNYLYLVLTRS
jgi:hypothetical protein